MREHEIHEMSMMSRDWAREGNGAKKMCMDVCSIVQSRAVTCSDCVCCWICWPVHVIVCHRHRPPQAGQAGSTWGRAIILPALPGADRPSLRHSGSQTGAGGKGTAERRGRPGKGHVSSQRLRTTAEAGLLRRSLIPSIPSCQPREHPGWSATEASCSQILLPGVKRRPRRNCAQA
jgi:hypothetical protein